jgi:hypothetical protein
MMSGLQRLAVAVAFIIHLYPQLFHSTNCSRMAFSASDAFPEPTTFSHSTGYKLVFYRELLPLTKNSDGLKYGLARCL